MVSALGSRVSSLALCVLGAILCSGCYDLKKQDPGIELTPDENGWVSVPEYGIQGHWFTYGDQYGVPARCVTLGRHVAESCSTIVSDDLQGLPKPLNGKMCITGQAAEVGKCVKPDWVECLKPRSAQETSGADDGQGGASAVTSDPSEETVRLPFEEGCQCNGPDCPFVGLLCNCTTPANMACNGDSDFPNIWGAGIGLDFSIPSASNDTARDPLARSPWDPNKYGVTGVAFDFSATEMAAYNDFFRVEFPMLLDAQSRVPSKSDANTGSSGAVSLVDATNVVGGGDFYPDSDNGERAVPSEEHPSGSPFWRDQPPDPTADSWNTPGTRLVHPGHNVIHFNEIHEPPFSQIDQSGTYKGHYKWDETSMVGIQFHVPAREKHADAFSFCISNLTLIRD